MTNAAGFEEELSRRAASQNPHDAVGELEIRFLYIVLVAGLELIQSTTERDTGAKCSISDLPGELLTRQNHQAGEGEVRDVEENDVTRELCQSGLSRLLNGDFSNAGVAYVFVNLPKVGGSDRKHTGRGDCSTWAKAECVSRTIHLPLGFPLV
jgi:hypothetical protein